VSLAFKRFNVYLRLSVVILLVGAIGLILFKNRNHAVNLWLFGLIEETRQVNVVWVILWTALITRVAWFIFAFSLRLWRDYRAIQKQDAVDQVTKEQQRREADLAERERRLNQQLAGDAAAKSDLKPWDV